MHADETILNGDKAAELLGSTERRIRSWVKSSKLPGRVLPDGSVAIVKSELIEWARCRSEITPDSSRVTGR